MANKTRIKKNHVITSILYHLLDTGRRQVRLQRDVAHFYTLLAASSKFATGHLPHLRGGDRGGRFLSSATRSLNSPPPSSHRCAARSGISPCNFASLQSIFVAISNGSDTGAYRIRCDNKIRGETAGPSVWDVANSSASTDVIPNRPNARGIFKHM